MPNIFKNKPNPSARLIDRRRHDRFSLRSLFVAIAICAVLLAVSKSVFEFVYHRPSLEIVVQASDAMRPTLGRDILVADMHAFRRAKPQRWQVVALRRQGAVGTMHVLRVIGLPGERVSFQGGKVFVDDQPLSPPPQLSKVRYHCELPGAIAHPCTVPKGSYYLLGDDPDVYQDSRRWGTIPESEILGHINRQ